ncbi:hypothetical protein ALC56_08036 [Trachymyrmex septentrionalis]|uniref:Uncharacterized protein n=1 Tax=Trachymyrmex septentrionalis TaxID=34720 RepID=A0A195FCA7_9HYME|nr:hypothetical protein ALC56_08036 [Trachymyrmex septentrionalis]
MSPLARMLVAKRQLSSRELRTSCFDYPLAFLPAHTPLTPARRFSEETKLPEMPPRHLQPPPPFNLEKFQRVQISTRRAAGRIISCPCRSLCRGVALPGATLKSNKARVCSRFVKWKKREVRRRGARRAGSTSKFFREARGQRRREKRRGKRGKDEKRTRTEEKKKNARDVRRKARRRGQITAGPTSKIKDARISDADARARERGVAQLGPARFSSAQLGMGSTREKRRDPPGGFIPNRAQRTKIKSAGSLSGETEAEDGDHRVLDRGRPETAGDQKKKCRIATSRARKRGKKNSEDEGKKDTTTRGWRVRRMGTTENRG